MTHKWEFKADWWTEVANSTKELLESKESGLETQVDRVFDLVGVLSEGLHKLTPADRANTNCPFCDGAL